MSKDRPSKDARILFRNLKTLLQPLIDYKQQHEIQDAAHQLKLNWGAAYWAIGEFTERGLACLDAIAGLDIDTDADTC